MIYLLGFMLLFWGLTLFALRCSKMDNRRLKRVIDRERAYHEATRQSDSATCARLQGRLRNMRLEARVITMMSPKQLRQLTEFLDRLRAFTVDAA